MLGMAGLCNIPLAMLPVARIPHFTTYGEEDMVMRFFKRRFLYFSRVATAEEGL